MFTVPNLIPPLSQLLNSATSLRRQLPVQSRQLQRANHLYQPQLRCHGGLSIRSRKRLHLLPGTTTRPPQQSGGISRFPLFPHLSFLPRFWSACRSQWLFRNSRRSSRRRQLSSSLRTMAHSAIPVFAPSTARASRNLVSTRLYSDPSRPRQSVTQTRSQQELGVRL